jgi:hypothetical protein
MPTSLVAGERKVAGHRNSTIAKCMMASAQSTGEARPGKNFTPPACPNRRGEKHHVESKKPLASEKLTERQQPTALSRIRDSLIA